MKTFALNKNNDFLIDENNNISLASNLQAMGCICVNKSLTNKGGVYYDTDQGNSYFAGVFWEIPDTIIFQSDLLQSLKDTNEVLDVRDYNYSIIEGENNSLYYKFNVSILTPYGEIQLNG